MLETEKTQVILTQSKTQFLINIKIRIQIRFVNNDSVAQLIVQSLSDMLL